MSFYLVIHLYRFIWGRKLKILFAHNFQTLKLDFYCSTDYVGFIKKVMKQMQQPEYVVIKKIEVDLRQLTEVEGQKANEGILTTR